MGKRYLVQIGAGATVLGDAHERRSRAMFDAWADEASLDPSLDASRDPSRDASSDASSSGSLIATAYDDRSDVEEHLSRDLARVRARFAIDPLPFATVSPLTRAWRSDADVEEDEAEFVDTLADCVGAGLSLGDALGCWESGELAAESTDEGGAAGDDEAGASITPAVPRRPTSGHRVVVR